MVNERGFTLLEVIVSMTIVAIAMGSLLAAMSGNKQLAFRATHSLHQSLSLRSWINLALLEEHREFHAPVNSDYLIRDTIRLEFPEDIGEEPPYFLSRFKIGADHSETDTNGIRWKLSDD